MNGKFRFIMLIDDDLPTNYFSELVIKWSECSDKVQSFMDAEAALNFLENSRGEELPDLILLDINMPGMNGWEFLEEYKKIQFHENCMPTICMITTSLNPDDELRYTKVDALSGFFFKPLKLETLQEIQTLIQVKNSNSILSQH